jgi:predicted nuclease of predicted toxin-antitoxin system
VKLLIDMNLSPQWVPALLDEGFEAVHWSGVGSPDATDEEIMRYAARNEFVIFTHDLDFGGLLALSQQSKPSVVQVRTTDVLPGAIGKIVVTSLRRFGAELEIGAIVTLDPAKQRVRILPLS